METFADLLKRYRKKAGLTQKELAQQCRFEGDSPQTRISNYEQGTREPKLHEIKKIAAALNQPMVKLIPGAWEELIVSGLAVEDENQELSWVRRSYDSLSPSNRSVLVETLKAMLSSQRSTS